MFLFNGTWQKKLVQFIKFGFVGLSNTIISLALYYTFLYFNIDYFIANIIAYLGSSICGYFLNRIWVFGEKKTAVKKSIIKYYIVYGSSLILNMGLMFLWVDMLNISELAAPVFTLLITIPYNFVFSKFWVFRS